MHDSGDVCECDEDADENEEGGLEVWQEEDGGKVDGNDGKTHVTVKLTSNDLKMKE